jgi:hypothetical protein
LRASVEQLYQLLIKPIDLVSPVVDVQISPRQLGAAVLRMNQTLLDKATGRRDINSRRLNASPFCVHPVANPVGMSCL